MIIRSDKLETRSGHESNWISHYQKHVNPELMTRLLREAVPVLDHLQWRVTEVQEGYAESVLPLSYPSTNQHGTHQAALIALSADYTGGLALATLLTGVPFAGVHPCREEDSASLWLADMSVRFRAPSTGHLIGKCRVPERLVDKIAKRYFAGKKVFVTLPIEFESNGEVVAEAEMKYFVQPSIQLRSTGEGSKDSPILKTKLKSSARMIAGVRAQTPNHKRIRIDHAHSSTAACEQGHLLAAHLRKTLPELTDLVHARTQHGDETLQSMPHLEQVVMLGVGLDMRPYQFFNSHPKVRWFELDLPAMLEERQRVIANLKTRQPAQRRMIAADLTDERFHERVLEHKDFDANKPTLVIFEGCTMYFSQEMNQQILKSCLSFLQHPESRLWCDIVSREVVEGATEFPKVQAFLRGMDELGERFIFGHDDPTELLHSCGFDEVAVTRSSDFLEISDAVHDMYRFVVAR